ncbi:MAG TPA: flagellar biosynthesis anti-sigma factor FlgM [Burkholderiales bacterium]|nr:flagellar biosynthesis anti-sigma factor FlgM [Burkholderiales bacterium]
MKINPPIDAVRPATSGTSHAAGQAGSGGTATRTPNAGDGVHLSSLANDLRTGAGSSSTSPAEFDQARVDAITNAIREGKFQVNTGAVADRLIESVQEWLSKAQ